MVQRLPVNSPQNIWFDSKQVDSSDLTLEQQHTNNFEYGLVNNHIGTGILPEFLTRQVLFDSESYLVQNPGMLDGKGITIQQQPSDSNYGNQIEIELTQSLAAGKRQVKLLVVGLNYQDDLVYEIFYFASNEIQVGEKHFKKIVSILLNDFYGPDTVSFNLGGKLVIREARSLTLSRCPTMLKQDVQPNLFFRDFYPVGFATVEEALASALNLYNFDSLNIKTQPSSLQVIAKNDVTTQVGQKFQALTNNIQKITVLLSVVNNDIGHTSELDWTGDLIVSVYKLQSQTTCPTDIIPNLQIEYDPFNIPLAQLSFNYNSLRQLGVQLNSVLQPVDFIFSDTTIATGNNIMPGAYYVFTIKRSGSANKCDIQIAAGEHVVENSRLTTFTGSLWVDNTLEDLWFQIWQDAAKVTDGSLYENGHGLNIPKLKYDSQSASDTDYSLNNIQFVGGDVFKATVFAKTDKNTPLQDQRTGGLVNSRQELVPEVRLLNTLEFNSLSASSEPFSIGVILDKNVKSITDPLILSNFRHFGFVNNEIVIKIADDSNDPIYDAAVSSLLNNLANGDLLGAKITPNLSSPNNVFRISKAEKCTMLYGDLNGDGIVDEMDVELFRSYLGFDFNVAPPTDTVITTDGYHTTVTNGYTTYINEFANVFGVDFQIIDPTDNSVVASGNDGVLVVDPLNPRRAQFTSATTIFNVMVGIGSFKVVVFSSTPANNGIFNIAALDVVNDVLTLSKILLTSTSISEMLKADVSNDYVVNYEDGYFIQNYVDKVNFTSDVTFPLNYQQAYNRIGTPFDVLKITVEPFIDRKDDYTTDVNSRNANTHTITDIFLSDNYFSSYDYSSAISFSIEKQLQWADNLIVVNSIPRLVPCVFNYNNGFEKNSCEKDRLPCEPYNVAPEFDPGKVDLFVPNNIVFGNSGQLKTAEGEFYKVDFEVGTVVLEIPSGLYSTERTINILSDFIADYDGQGKTRLGYHAMRFADCSFVQTDVLEKDQARFSIAVQSFSPNTNGVDEDMVSGIIVDGKIGVSFNYETGLLTLNFTNLFQDAILRTLSTKIQITVFLKKAGFNNKTLFIDSNKVKNINELISIFSGPAIGGPSALIDLENDVSGITPLNHGGTGLNAVGPAGTVLVSDGQSLSYQYLSGSGGPSAPLYDNITPVYSDYTATVDDVILAVQPSPPPNQMLDIRLPYNPPVGKKYIIKDMRGIAGSSNNKIRIKGIGVGTGWTNIDTAEYFFIDSDFASVTLVYDGYSWIVL